MVATTFDDLTDVYEAIIDWPKRLAHETPFYRQLFAEIGARRVLDVACGTGRHAALFHSWGLEVEGADVSANMIARAQALHGEPEGLRWAVRGFDQPMPAATQFDVAICVGNSLALAPGLTAVALAVTQMIDAVRPGGAVVIQVLNLWSLPDGPCLWQKALRTNVGGQDSMIIKGVHRCGTGGFVELIVADPNGERPLRSESVPLLGLEQGLLREVARQSRATDVRCYAGYQDQPYVREKSGDLLVVIRR